MISLHHGYSLQMLSGAWIYTTYSSSLFFNKRTVSWT